MWIQDELPLGLDEYHQHKEDIEGQGVLPFSEIGFPELEEEL